MRNIVMCLFLVCLGCAKEKNEITKTELSTNAIPLAIEAYPSFNTDETCDAIQKFLNSYKDEKLTEVNITFDCREVSGQNIHSDDELEKMPLAENTSCNEGRRCFKANFSLTKNDLTDNYYALVVRFDDGENFGIINSYKENKHFLPRNGIKVFEGQLLDDGLSNLIETFRSWTEHAEST